MKTKIIPFDAKMAKDIQDGKIKGKIRTERGEEVLLYKNDSNEFKCWIHEERDGIHIAYGNSDVLNLFKLYLEVPDNEPQFKPFDKVLVRDEDQNNWNIDFFGYKSGTGFVCLLKWWKQCIPYEGNEYLIGTTDKPKEG